LNIEDYAQQPVQNHSLFPDKYQCRLLYEWIPDLSRILIRRKHTHLWLTKDYKPRLGESFRRSRLTRMPCACLLPPEVYPDASEWGPLLWTVLHSIAERVGSPSFPQYAEDERRALIKMIKQLEKVIPCPSCREHYEVYLREHPLEKPLKELGHSELKEYIKTWFWELHNWVNESLQHPIYDFAGLTAQYGRTDLRDALKRLDVPMMRAIRVKSGQLFAYKEFVKQVNILLSIYGV